MSDSSGLFVLDPRPPVRTDIVPQAARLDTLDGACIALIRNGKTHGSELLEYVIDELSAKYAIAGVLRLGPPSPGYGGNPADVGPAAEQVMAAISAIGD